MSKTRKGWPIRKLSVKGLILDPENPRIPGSSSDLKQSEIITDLVDNDNVLDLANDILRDGYDGLDPVIVYRKNNKFYVAEGNRRICALKLLLEPSKYSGNKYTRNPFIRLAKELKENITKIEVVEVPDYDSAIPYISRRHIKQDIEKWETVQQSLFYARQFAKIGDINDCANSIGIEKSDLCRHVRASTLYFYLCNEAILDEGARNDAVNPRQFPASTFMRICESESGKDFIGIRFEGHRVFFLREKKHRDKVFNRILLDIFAPDPLFRVTSRNLNKTEDLEKYLLRLEDEIGKYTGGNDGKPQEEEIAIPEFIFSESENKDKVPKPSTKKKKPIYMLISPDLECLVENRKIQDVVNELKGLSVDRFPNAVGVLLRGLLEMSVAYYFIETERYQAIIDKERMKRNGKLPSDWGPPLSDLLKRIVNDVDIKLLPQAKKTINLLLNDDKFLSLERMHQIVHNHVFLISPGELRNYWDMLKPLFEFLWEETAVQDIDPAIS